MYFNCVTSFCLSILVGSFVGSPEASPPAYSNYSFYNDQKDQCCPKKKVFILHFIEQLDDHPALKLAVALRRMAVDATIDLFEHDNPPNSWPPWYEQKIKESDVVLCIITESFYYQLTNSNYILGYSVENLMNRSRNITFQAVFIDAKKELEYIPPGHAGVYMLLYMLKPTDTRR